RGEGFGFPGYSAFGLVCGTIAGPLNGFFGGALARGYSGGAYGRCLARRVFRGDGHTGAAWSTPAAEPARRVRGHFAAGAGVAGGAGADFGESLRRAPGIARHGSVPPGAIQVAGRVAGDHHAGSSRSVRASFTL